MESCLPTPTFCQVAGGVWGLETLLAGAFLWKLCICLVQQPEAGPQSGTYERTTINHGTWRRISNITDTTTCSGKCGHTPTETFQGIAENVADGFAISTAVMVRPSEGQLMAQAKPYP